MAARARGEPGVHPRGGRARQRPGAAKGRHLDGDHTVGRLDVRPASGRRLLGPRVREHLRAPLPEGREGRAARASRPVVEVPRSDQAPGHAPEGREVPQRERAHRRGREVHVRAPAQSERPGPGRGGHQDAQDAHPGRGPLHAHPRDAGAQRRDGRHPRPVAGDPDPGLRRDQEVGEGLRAAPLGDRPVQARGVGARPEHQARAESRLLERPALRRLPRVQGGARGGDPRAGAGER